MTLDSTYTRILSNLQCKYGIAMGSRFRAQVKVIAPNRAARKPFFWKKAKIQENIDFWGTFWSFGPSSLSQGEF